MLSRVPYPLDKGDKLRAFHQIKELSKTHEIYLCCLDDKKTDPKSYTILYEFCTDVMVIRLRKWQIILNMIFAFFSRLPFQVWYFYQKHAHKKIRRKIEEIKPEHIYCQLIRTAEYVKNEHGIPKTLDYMDTFSKGIERRVKSAGIFKPVFKAEHQRLVRYENLIFEYFENKTIISEQDRDFIFHPNRDTVKIIPNGVDTEYFSPIGIDKKYDLVFVGNMSYAPNIESANYLVKEILPLLIKKKPGVKILIAGSSPQKSVIDLACENVDVSGWVDDIRLSYSSAKIFIAALNIGTGLQNKLLEAMAMEIPCVTSELANNALKAKPGVEVLIGKSPEEYVKLIMELLENPDRREELAEAGKKYVQDNFSWKKSTEELTLLIEKTKL